MSVNDEHECTRQLRVLLYRCDAEIRNGTHRPDAVNGRARPDIYLRHSIENLRDVRVVLTRFDQDQIDRINKNSHDSNGVEES